MQEKPQHGFTLIEIMLVLVVISVMAGLATIALGPNPHNTLNREARRLQAVMEMAAEEAVLQGTQWALALPERGYQFLVFDSDKFAWNEVTAKPFALHQLDSAVSLKLHVEGQHYDPEAGERLARMRTAADQSLRPALILLSSGEITPFRITFRYDQLDSIVVLQSDGVSEIELIEGMVN